MVGAPKGSSGSMRPVARHSPRGALGPSASVARRNIHVDLPWLGSSTQIRRSLRIRMLPLFRRGVRGDQRAGSDLCGANRSLVDLPLPSM